MGEVSSLPVTSPRIKLPPGVRLRFSSRLLYRSPLVGLPLPSSLPGGGSYETRTRQAICLQGKSGYPAHDPRVNPHRHNSAARRDGVDLRRIELPAPSMPWRAAASASGPWYRRRESNSPWTKLSAWHPRPVDLVGMCRASPTLREFSRGRPRVPGVRQRTKSSVTSRCRNVKSPPGRNRTRTRRVEAARTLRYATGGWWSMRASDRSRTCMSPLPFLLDRSESGYRGEVLRGVGRDDGTRTRDTSDLQSPPLAAWVRHGGRPPGSRTLS